MNKRVAAAILATITASIGCAEMASASYSSPHKSTVAGKTKIYIPGQAAGGEVVFTTPGVAKDKALTLNKCGWGGFAVSATKPVINITGGSANFASMTTGAAPTCVAGADGTYAVGPEAQGTLVKDPTGKIWYKGAAASSSVVLNVTSSSSGKTKANACGIAAITVSATRPMTVFDIAGTTYGLPGIPDMANPSLCKKTATGTGILYAPVNQ